VKKMIVLGNIPFREEIDVDKAKTDLIVILPPRGYVKGVRSFLRRAGFYYHFIEGVSKTTKPLTNLLAKDVPFHFSEGC